MDTRDAGRLGGLARTANMTPEELKAATAKAGRSRWSRVGPSGLGSAGWGRGPPKQTVCGLRNDVISTCFCSFIVSKRLCSALGLSIPEFRISRPALPRPGAPGCRFSLFFKT